MAEKWPIFVCYRQSDGMPTARRVYELLHGQPLPLLDGGNETGVPPELDVYFDQAAPGVSDWKSVHEPYLKRSRAIIVICTPGAKLIEGDKDWVHQEINWWLSNRELAPILVDPLGEDTRYVPGAILDKWPDAQRIALNEASWSKMSKAELRQANDRVRAQLVGGIVPSAKNFFRQEFEQEQKRVAELNQALQQQKSLSGRYVWALRGMTLLLLVALAAVVVALLQTRWANQDRVAAELAYANLKEAQLRNQLLNAQQLLAKDQFRDAITLATKLRQEAASENSPVANERPAIDAIIVRSVNNLIKTQTCPPMDRDLRAAAFSPDGSRVAAVADDIMVPSWSTADCSSAAAEQTHEDTISAIAWADNGSLASVSWDRVIRLSTGETVKPGAGKGRIVGLDFLDGSDTLASLSSFGDIVVTTLGQAPGAQTDGVVPPPAGYRVARLVEGAAALLVSEEGSIAVMDVGSGKLTGPVQLDPHKLELRAVLNMPGRDQFIVGMNDGAVWLAGPGEAALTGLGRQTGGLIGVSAAPDASAVLTYTEGEITIWSLDDPARQPVTLRPFAKDIEQALLVARDLVLTADDAGTVRLISTPDQQTFMTLEADPYTREPLFLSPDGTMAGLVMRDGTIGYRALVTDATSALSYYCSHLIGPDQADAVTCGAGDEEKETRRQGET